MRIRTLLSLSHALVIGIFIITFLAIFFTLTERPGPPPGRGRSEPWVRLLGKGYGEERLARELKDAGFRDVQTVDIFDEEGRHERLIGPSLQLEPPPFLSYVLVDGHHLGEDAGPGRAHLFWFPIKLNSGEKRVVRLRVENRSEQFFNRVKRNILLACGVAFLAVLLVALLLSRALAEPIRQLASLVDRFGREGFGLRSNIKGTAELEELSQSFNRMADYIETNTNQLKDQKEQAERTEALRRQFLSDVSHNLRTPLTAIMGWNDALIEGVAEDEVLYRSRIRREVLNVTRTVQRLLELSRWERHEPILLREDIPLSDLLLEVAETLQEVAEQSGVSLSFEGLSPDLSIYADRQKARDVFQILLENVVEHAGEGVHAKVTVVPQEEVIKFRIEDDGVGLPSTFQGEPDMERGASEVGRACLGLAIASRLVRAHGGDLVLSNRDEGGASARFSFPRSTPENKKEAGLGK